MTFDIILGAILIFVGLGFLIFITMWSRSVINRIAEKDHPPLRTIIEDIYHGR